LRVQERIKRHCNKIAMNPALPLFLLLFTVYLFSAGGHLYSYDELLTYATTGAIAEEGSTNIARAVPLLHELGFLKNVPDDVPTFYSSYGLLQSAMAVPFYLAGKSLGVEPWITVGLFYSPMLMATSGPLVYGVSRRLGMSSRLAMVLSLLYGFATIAWPYAKFFFDVTAGLVMQLTAVYFLIDPSCSRRSIFLSGLFAILSVFGRLTQLVGLPALLLYLAFRPRADLRRRTRLEVFMIPVVAGSVLYVCLNAVRSGSPFIVGASYTGRLLSETLAGNALVGTYGLLFSAGVGLFLYYPLCALGSFTLVFSDMNHNWEGFLFASLFLSNLLFFGSLVNWADGVAWGARYLVPTVPYLVLACIPFVESAKTSIVRASVLLCAALVGVFSNVLGVLINFLYANGYSCLVLGADCVRPGLSPTPAIWRPEFSQVRASWDLVWSQKYPAVWYPSRPEIFYLKARFDLFLYNSYGITAVVITVLLALLWALWIAMTLRRD
jgi:hypothetical protein